MGLVFTSQTPFGGGCCQERSWRRHPPPPSHLHMLLQMAGTAAPREGKGFKLKPCLRFWEGFWLRFLPPSLSRALPHLPSSHTNGAGKASAGEAAGTQPGSRGSPPESCPTEKVIQPIISPLQVGVSPYPPQLLGNSVSPLCRAPAKSLSSAAVPFGATIPWHTGGLLGCLVLRTFIPAGFIPGLLQPPPSKHLAPGSLGWAGLR